MGAHCACIDSNANDDNSSIKPKFEEVSYTDFASEWQSASPSLVNDLSIERDSGQGKKMYLNPHRH